MGESGSAYVVSGSPAGQTYIDKMYIGRVTSRGYSNGEYHEGRFPYWHYHAGTWCSGGRKCSGCKVSGEERLKVEWVLYPTDWGNNAEWWEYDGYASGTVTKPDDRVWRKNYSGVASKTVSFYEQDYKGTVTKPDTRIWRQDYGGTVYQGGTDYYYKYKVTVKYIDNQIPELSVNFPESGSFYGKEVGNNTISFSGNVLDKDVEDNLKIKYTLYDVSRGRNVEGHTDVLVKNIGRSGGSSHSFNYSIEVDSNMLDGEHNLKVIAEDDKGGVSERSVRINIDKTPPNIFSPYISLKEPFRIIVGGNTTDSGSGLDVNPYSFSINSGEWGIWSSENFKTFTGLKPNTRYAFTMRAIDKMKNIRVSETIYKYTLAEVPGLVIYDASGGTVIGKIDGKGNNKDTQYKVEYSLDQNNWENFKSRDEWSTDLDIRESGFKTGKTYYIRISAKNGDGDITHNVVDVFIEDPLSIIGGTVIDNYKAGQAMLLNAETDGRAVRVDVEVWYNDNGFTTQRKTSLVPSKSLGNPVQKKMTWGIRRDDRDKVVIIPKHTKDGEYSIVFTAYKELINGEVQKAEDIIKVGVTGSIYDKSKSEIAGN